jgi:hypothetical protein
MSEPKRYRLDPESYLAEHPQGDFVDYQDYARLKAEVERLSQPAVIGGYNLSQYIRMANSETLEFDNGDIFADMTLPERIKYIVESHARLKAEVERLKMSAYNRLSMRIEIDKLNARIERLIKAGDLMADGINGDYNYSLPCIEKWEAAKKGGQP